MSGERAEDFTHEALLEGGEPGGLPVAHGSLTHVLRVRNRPGNVYDSRGAVAFLREVWGPLATLGVPSSQIHFRMDGAFFQQDVLRRLAWREVGYTIKVPFFHWFDLQQFIRGSSGWMRVSA